MSRKSTSAILLTLLALSMSLLAFNLAVRKAEAVPDPWEMPVIYMKTSTPVPNTLQVGVSIYNLSNRFYTTNEDWSVGQPLPPYVEETPRYNYTLGNLYGLQFSLSWNPTVLSYTSHVTHTGVEGDPDAIPPDPPSPGGVLHNAIDQPVDDVDAILGTYNLSCSSRAPADVFNSQGAHAKVFNMTFAVLGGGDNELTIDDVGLVTNIIALPGIQQKIPWRFVMHDVAVKQQTPNKDIVGQGYGVSVDVLIKNTGDFDETFQLNVYLGASSIGTVPTSVAKGSSKTVTVTCTVSVSIAKGTYSLKVVAALGSDEDTSDNEKTEGSILVTIPGDVDGNRTVNIFDIVKMAGVYGKAKPDPNYNPYCDIDNNGIINIFDIVIAAGNYGKSW